MRQLARVQRADAFLRQSDGQLLRDPLRRARSHPSPKGRGKAIAEVEQRGARRAGCDDARERGEEALADESLARAGHDRLESGLLEDLEEGRSTPPGQLRRRGNELDRNGAGEREKGGAIRLGAWPTQCAGQGTGYLPRREGDRSPRLHLDPGKSALCQQPRQLAQRRRPPLDSDGEARRPLVCGASDPVRFRCLADEEERHRPLGLLRSEAAPEARQLLAKSVLEAVVAGERQPREPQTLSREAPFGAWERVDRGRSGSRVAPGRTLRPAARAQGGEQRPQRTRDSLRGSEPIDEADARRAPRIQPLAEKDFHRGVQSEQPRQALRGAEEGNERVVAQLRHVEVRVVAVARNTVIAGQGDLEAAAVAVALDGGDRRYRV